MSFLLDYLDYVVNTIMAPREYFRHHREQGTEIREGLKIAFVSSILLGLFSSFRSVIAVSFGEFSTGIGSSELASTVLRNSLSGSLTYLISLLLSFVLVHIMVRVLGGSDWKKTFNAITYSSPLVFLTGSVIVGYQLIESFIIGFPLIRYLGLGAVLFYTAYVQARGLEALHEMSFGRSIVATITPAVVSVIASAALFIMYMSMMLSAI